MSADVPEDPDRAEVVARLRRYLWVNAICMAGSVVALGILYLTLLQSIHVAKILLLLAAGTGCVALGLVLAKQGRTAGAALAQTAANWVVAFGAVWVSPFTLPIGLMSLLSPVVVVVEFLSLRARRVLLVATVAGAGLISGWGEYCRSMAGDSQPDTPIAVGILLVFVTLVTAVTLVGVRQHLTRLGRQAQEVASSRARLAQAADEARRAIERDLHDGAQQQLVTVSVELGRVGRLIEHDPARAAVEIKEVHTHLVEAIRELRDLAHGIYPALLQERGLAAALPAAARRTETPCRVHVDGLGRLPAQLESAVYFTCLEAMHNADKHARAGQIAVGLTQARGNVVFTVADDGCGLSSSRRTPDGRGLTGMVDRVKAAGGELVVTSAPGGGTLVRGRIPLPA